MSEPVHHDPRAEARTAWTRAALGDDDAVPVRASMDAGFRSYWRVAGADGSCIVMDSPPDKEDVRDEMLDDTNMLSDFHESIRREEHPNVVRKFWTAIHNDIDQSMTAYEIKHAQQARQ